MSEFGLLPTGFAAKRLTDVRQELEQTFRDAFGAGIRLTPETTFGKIIGIVAERETSLWELMEAVYDAQYPGTASDVSLDRIGEITAVSRNPATRSTATVYVTGQPNTEVRSGSLIGVLDAGDQFQTTEDVTLGSIGRREIATLTSSAGMATATASAHGYAPGDWVFVTGADPVAYNGLVRVSSAMDPDTFTYPVTGTPVSPATGSIVGDRTHVPAESVAYGPIQALAGTLTEIVNATPGWEQARNAEDAQLGRLEETDAAFRTRRVEALQGLGAARLEALRGAVLALQGVNQAKVFENDSDLTDSGGRPPHSIEVLVVGGDNVQEIFDTVWDKKAAGIQTHGTEVGSTTDSQGHGHTVYYSSPTSVGLTLEVGLGTNGDFPADGTELVENRLLDFGNALEIGEDVVVYPYLVAAFDDVPGIQSVSMGIGTDAASLDSANIPIGETAVARFDSGNITVTASQVAP